MYFVPDSMIVARHEVLGQRTPKEPSRRVRYDSCPCAHRFENWREEISTAVSLSRIEMIPKMLWRRLRPCPSPGKPAYGIGRCEGRSIDKGRIIGLDPSKISKPPKLAQQGMAYSALVSRRFRTVLLEAAARTSSDTNLSRRVFSLPKETRRTFRREIPVGSAAPDHTVPSGTVLSRDAFPGTSCLATISLSLRDKNHSPIEGPRIKLAGQSWDMLSWFFSRPSGGRVYIQKTIFRGLCLYKGQGNKYSSNDIPGVKSCGD